MSSDDAHAQQLDRLLKTWANNICDTTKEIISAAMSGRSAENLGNLQSQHQIFDDIRDRQSRVISVSTFFTRNIFLPFNI